MSASHPAQVTPALGVSDQEADPLGQSGGVTVGNEKTGLTVQDYFRNASRSRRHYRQSRRLRLHQRDRRSLLIATHIDTGKNENVSRSHQIPDIGPLTLAVQSDQMFKAQ